MSARRPEEEGAVFPRNCWYVAAWDHEVRRLQPMRRLLLGEPVALYRVSDGTPVALEDRCCHRHAQLSRGRVRGDTIECAYHGLRFARDGACVHIPSQTHIPGAARGTQLSGRREVPLGLGLARRSGAGRREPDSGFPRHGPPRLELARRDPAGRRQRHAGDREPDGPDPSPRAASHDAGRHRDPSKRDTDRVPDQGRHGPGRSPGTGYAGTGLFPDARRLRARRPGRPLDQHDIHAAELRAHRDRRGRGRLRSARRRPQPCSHGLESQRDHAGDGDQRALFLGPGAGFRRRRPPASASSISHSSTRRSRRTSPSSPASRKTSTSIRQRGASTLLPTAPASKPAASSNGLQGRNESLRTPSDDPEVHHLTGHCPASPFSTAVRRSSRPARSSPPSS